MALVGDFGAVLAAQTAECLHGNPEGVARVLVTPVTGGPRARPGREVSFAS